MTNIYAVYDTTGIQSYIFSSTKLRENMGASVLVREVLKNYLKQSLKEVLGPDNVAVDWDDNCDKCLRKFDRNGGLLAEVVYVGGGNAFVAFVDEEAYKDTTKHFLLQVYKETTSIGIASAFIKTDFEQGYAQQHKDLMEQLLQAKGKINRPIPAGNQPITRASLLTGLPVVEVDNFTPISTEQVQKRKARDQMKSSFEEFSDIVRGSKSYLAVIHVDGNNMGKLIEEYASGENWGEIVPKIREMSKRIATLYKEAYARTKSMFLDAYKHTSHYKLAPELPLIKIILDGDDVTCVVSGQYGISFAAEFLRIVENLNNDKAFYPFLGWDKNPKITACAGVVLFHSHYPFSAAYKMAEECCANAKRYTRKTNIVGSFIDFHLHQSGAVTNLKQYRRGQYTADNGYLLNRPYCVSCVFEKKAFKGKYPLYCEFKQLIKNWIKAPPNNQSNTNPWPRSRLKALRAVIGDNDKADEILKWCKSRGYDLPKGFDFREENAIKAINTREDRSDNELKNDAALLFDVLDLADTYEDITDKEAR